MKYLQGVETANLERIQEIQNKLSEVLNQMKQCGIEVTELRKVWGDSYKIASEYELESYQKCLSQLDFQGAYVLSRQLNVLAQKTQRVALEKDDSYLYHMGTFNGILAAYKNTLEQQSEEKVFIVQMQKLIGRAHMRDVVVYIYHHSYVQNKKICEDLQLQPNMLYKVLKPLEEVECIYRYTSGRNAFYKLTQKGVNYVRNVLGCTEMDVVDVEPEIITGYLSRNVDESPSLMHRNYVKYEKKEKQIGYTDNIKFMSNGGR